MKWVHRALLACVCAVVLTGCGSGVSYYNDWDRDVDFNGFKTYAWIVQPTPVGDARTAANHNDLLAGRIRSAVDRQLELKGLALDTASPDVLLVYHTGVESKVNVTDWGYRYSYDYWGPRQIDVYQYDEGTLIVDVIDTQSKELIWRGSATGTVDSNPSVEKQERKLNEVASRMFDKFPPPEKK